MIDVFIFIIKKDFLSYIFYEIKIEKNKLLI